MGMKVLDYIYKLVGRSGYKSSRHRFLEKLDQNCGKKCNPRHTASFKALWGRDDPTEAAY